MVLKKYKAEAYSKYVVDNIKHVINEFGPRDPGSEGETKGQNYVKEELGKYTDEVKIEPFQVAPKAFMGFLPVVGVIILISFFIYWFYPIVALLLDILAVIILVQEFLRYKLFLDPFFPKRTSHNVWGIKKPEGEIKKRIILAGHIDAAYDWRITRINPKLLRILVVPAVIGLFYKAISDLLCTILNYGWPQGWVPFWSYVGFIQFAFIPFLVVIIFFVDWSIVVPGANDNLTGSFVSVALAKLMEDNNLKLKNTEIYFMVTGSEEAGLRGAKAFVKKHERELKEIETIMIAIDTFADIEYLAAMSKDLNGTVKHHPGVLLLLKKSAEKIGFNLKYSSVFIGSSDATAFTQVGIPSAALTAMDPGPPKWYHTHFDTIDVLKPKCIEKSIEILMETLYMYDEEGLPSEKYRYDHRSPCETSTSSTFRYR